MNEKIYFNLVNKNICSRLTRLFIRTQSCQMTFSMTCSILITEAFYLILISLIAVVFDNNIL